MVAWRGELQHRDFTGRGYACRKAAGTHEGVHVGGAEKMLGPIHDGIVRAAPIGEAGQEKEKQEQGGEAYLLQRSEYFEPIPGSDPATAIDPIKHPKDPFDPQDAHNSDLVYFMLFDEWNGADWVPVDYPYGVNPDNPVLSTWRFSLRFSESMDVGSFRPYETFYVAAGPALVTDPSFNAMELGKVTSRNRKTIVSFEPVQDDQFGVLGGDVFRGFGRAPRNLRLVLRGIPQGHVLDAFYESLGPPYAWPPEVVEDLRDEGVLGVANLSGQPLGFPRQFYDVYDPNCILRGASPGRGPFPPAFDYGLVMDCRGDPSLDEIGVVVHRFMGMPETAADPQTGETGVVFRDHDDDDGTHTDNEIYGPHIVDINLGSNGFLSGHPVEFIEHVFDDYNPPSHTSPSAPDPIFKMPFGAGTPINASYGARFQQVYRRGEASPDVPIFGDTVLDLIGLAWCPIGGHVTNTYIKEMSIALSMCSLEIDKPYPNASNPQYYYDEPNTRESGGIPHSPDSGLKKKFDEARRINTGVPPDIRESNVFAGAHNGVCRDDLELVLGHPINRKNYVFNEENYLGIINGTVYAKAYTDGRSYLIDNVNLFAPHNQGNDFNYYLAYPEFDCPKSQSGFGYDSSRGLLVDIRTDDNLGTPVSPLNGYTFHAGILTSQLPRFRVFARASPSTPRTIFAASDPFDMVTPPTNPQTGEPDDTWSWIHAWDGGLPGPASYGDNARYFMIFNYAKRVSTVESPWLRVLPDGVAMPEYLPPVVTPPLDRVSPGTNLTIWFSAAEDENGLNPSEWVLPEEMDLLNFGSRPWIRFRATFEANLVTGEVPALDTVVIPYKR